MSARFSAGKRALGICDVCGFQYKLKELKPVIASGRETRVLACRACWDVDHPQNDLGKYPVFDPQAIQNSRPDNAELAASRTLITPVYNVGATLFLGNVTVSI